MNEQIMIKAINKLRPDSEFSFTDCDYSTIVWEKLEGQAPTKQQVNNAMALVTAELDAALVERSDAKAALLERLGITADEAALLLG
jgi:hypothetical protein